MAKTYFSNVLEVDQVTNYERIILKRTFGLGGRELAYWWHMARSVPRKDRRLTFLFLFWKFEASAAGNQTHLDQLITGKKWILEDIIRLDRQQESPIAAAHEQSSPFYEKELRYILQSQVNYRKLIFFFFFFFFFGNNRLPTISKILCIAIHIFFVNYSDDCMKIMFNNPQ